MFPFSPPFALAPMAGLTDTAFRRLVKRLGGCGLVVTEMVSSEGLARGADRTRRYAAFTGEERPVAVQIFGADPETMARAARLVEQMGADAIDVNMGCPVRKVAGHRAGCGLMRDPARAEAIVGAMARAVRVPVTVKMRAGWSEQELNAPDLARRLEGAGAAAVAVHGRTAAQAYGGRADWRVVERVARAVSIPVYGNGDCLDADEAVRRLRESGAAGVLIGRGALANPWIFSQAWAVVAGRPAAAVTPEARQRFLLDYIDLLLAWQLDDRTSDRPAAAEATGGRRGRQEAAGRSAGAERWVIGKIRALCAWYTKGLPGGSGLRAAVNRAGSIGELRDDISRFFAPPGAGGRAAP